MSWVYMEQGRRRASAEQNLVSLGSGDRLRVCLCYPNTYSVGMSNLGFQTLYYLLNSIEGVRCERAFLPDSDIGRGPLLSLETETPLGDFDVIAFSISFDLDVVNVPRMLRLAGIPIFAQERACRPIVLAGGIFPTFNPEPLADMVDVYVIGEAEEVVQPLTERLAELVKEEEVSQEHLRSLAELPGVYVPALYTIQYNDDGAIAAIEPHLDVPSEITRACVRHLEEWPCHSRVLTEETEFGGLFLVEVSRGCGRGCRFCVSGHVYRPLRHRPAEQVISTALAGLQHRKTIGLIGAAVSDHPEISTICRAILDAGGHISPASIRADTVTPDLLEALVSSGTKTLTIAPEAGSERLRRHVRKGITDAHIVAAVETAAQAGLKRLRLYFMLGLPDETAEDMQSVHQLVRAVREHGASHVTVSACAFVPKPQTPFERESMAPRKVIRERFELLRRLLAKEQGVEVSFESPNSSFLQAIVSRGDRRLSSVLAYLAELSEPSFADWQKVLRAEDLDGEWYANRRRLEDEILPWSHIGR